MPGTVPVLNMVKISLSCLYTLYLLKATWSMLMGIPLMIQPSPTLLSFGIEAGLPFEIISANTKTTTTRTSLDDNSSVIRIAIKWICKRLLWSAFYRSHHAVIADSGKNWLVGVSEYSTDTN